MLLALVACLAFVAYTYFVYPLLIAVAARLWPQKIAGDETWTPMVSVCMPVFNSSAFIDAKLQSLLRMPWPADKLEILIFDDASSDASPDRLQEWGQKDARIRVFTGDRRAGKPSALNQLVPQARGEVVFLTDVRQQVDVGVLRALVSPLADPRVGMVSGALTLTGSAGSGMYWRYEKWIRSNEARFRSVVGVSGAVAAIRKADMPVLPADLILDDVFTPMRLRLQGRLIWLANDALVYDEAFEDEREFGRKVRTLAGNFQLFALLPRLLLPGVNPSWFETMSHKLARLVCPLALVAALGINLTLVSAASGWQLRLAQGLLLGQALFYAAAWVGPRAGKVGSLCRTFVVLHTAIVVGFVRFVRGRQRVTW